MSIDFGNDIYEEPIVAKTFLQEDAHESSLRPKSLREYIGQEKAKDNLSIFIEAARRREEAQALLPSLTPDTIVPTLHRLDEAYIARNLSPGGCADLLSLALALEFLAECGLILPDPAAGTPLSHIY